MRIKNITLHNFGSYRGNNQFHFEVNRLGKRVVVIGGKNGAGKTTLFTAIQVCLYGNFAFGFKTSGKRYLAEIYDLINDQVRIEKNASAFVEIDFEQVDNTDLFNYTIRRTWTWPQNTICENLAVWKNGCRLEEEELLNFQNYLIHLIPPDLLKLYFFDGEKIADYFLSSKEVNIRDALMVLSGNDTFDILHDQVRRVLKGTEGTQNGSAQEYLSACAEVDEKRQEVDVLQQEFVQIKERIEEIGVEIEQEERNYEDRGGVTIDKWTELHDQLKTEEEKRERLNWQRKTYATDLLPFAMIPELVSGVLPQIQSEKEYQTDQALRRSLEKEEFAAVLEKALNSIDNHYTEKDSRGLLKSISDYLLDQKWEHFEPLFGLSSDEEGQVQSVLSRVSTFDSQVLARLQKRTNASLEKSKKIRNDLQNSSIEDVEGHMKTIAVLKEEKRVAELKCQHTKEFIELKETDLKQKVSRLNSLRRAFEEELKVNSVSDVSGKMLLLLEELQDTLYTNLIQQVESDLNRKFAELIRKKDFFSYVKIDRNFSVHILRETEIDRENLLSLLRSGGVSAATDALGETAVAALKERCHADSAAELRKAVSCENEKIVLPVEINKDQLSSGEKQIFVMSLYWAMMQQSKNELPFIIDTPFARIDTEHRANITEFFFKKLNGQLLILSTNEELSNHHLQAMSEQISHVYMLEYGLDKQTHIQENRYFEV